MLNVSRKIQSQWEDEMWYFFCWSWGDRPLGCQCTTWVEKDCSRESDILDETWCKNSMYPSQRKGVSVLREGAGRTAGVKEHCLLYCGCSTGCYHEELWGIRAGENVCCLEENSDKTRRRLILNNSILDNNKFRFYTAATLSSMDWLQNYLASLLKIQISGQRSGYSNLFGQ